MHYFENTIKPLTEMTFLSHHITSNHNTKRHSLVQSVFKSACFSIKQNLQFKIHLFSILNTKQTNDGIFSNKAGENFNLAKIF